MSLYESDLEDSCRTLEDEVARLNREKDTLENRLNDAEDVLRWVAKLDPDEGWKQAEKRPSISELYAFAWGWATADLKVIVQRAKAFLNTAV